MKELACIGLVVAAGVACCVAIHKAPDYLPAINEREAHLRRLEIERAALVKKQAEYFESHPEYVHPPDLFVSFR